MENPPLFNKVLRFISIRPRSKKEVKDYIKTKLYKKKLEISQIDKVTADILVSLSDLDLLNDEDFANSWIDWRLTASSPKGLKIVNQELLLKGISKDTINRLLENRKYKDMEVEAAKRVVSKKFKKVSNIFKVKNYLYARGFTGSSIESAID